ncbi:uncharacterized protein, partial [Typha angustifolia]|uniref:uncharacterized protein n=1 Tax=Typha angustifolia TaxID=59011 RepID=UPI003C30E29A
MGEYRARLALTEAVARSLPNPSAMRSEALRVGEGRAQEIIYCVQPTKESEKKRHRVIEYVRKLIGSAVDCEVFPFGSVPLKTYLPDGDIDLTALGSSSSDSTLVSDVRCLLESEEDDEDAEFEIKDVQYINAEVRLIKCLIQNIVVDISFNQIGGLCTLCFLELVDHQIGKDHLFKRSILLIKAWCYYESRILGAHHGLISTYALETLILYIFHLFHKSLDGPLAVLYRFLEYFSKFDWNNYGISLYGPVVLSSLPNLVVEMRDIDSSDLLISKEFLKSSLERFSVPPGDSEKSSAKFVQKNLNIIDPLREHNNLGRSVSKGNFYRIRSAFTYGARRLGQILMLPQERIADEISLFFMNTLERHGTGERPDLKDRFPSGSGDAELDATGFSTMSCELEIEKGDDLTSCAQSIYPHEALCRRISSMKVSTFDIEYEMDSPQHPVKILSKVESDVRRTDEHLESGRSLGGETKVCDVSTRTETCSSSSAEAQYGPYLMSHPENRDGFGDVGSADFRNRNGSTNIVTTTRSSFDFSVQLTDSHFGTIQSPPLLSLSEFAGDLKSNLRYLRGVQYYLECMFGGLLQSVQEVFPIQLDDERESLVDESCQPSESPQQSMFFHMGANALVSAPYPSPNAE